METGRGSAIMASHQMRPCRSMVTWIDEWPGLDELWVLARGYQPRGMSVALVNMAIRAEGGASEVPIFYGGG